MRFSGWAAPMALLGLAGCATTNATAPSAPAPAVSATPAPPMFTEADFIGRNGADLDALLGPAALIRKEGRGEFRRYAFADCALIIILYPDDSGKAVVSRLDAAAKSAGDGAPDLDQCLAAGAPQKGAP